MLKARGLASAIGPKQPNDLGLAHTQTHATYDFAATVDFSKPITSSTSMSRLSLIKPTVRSLAPNRAVQV